MASFLRSKTEIISDILQVSLADQLVVISLSPGLIQQNNCSD